MREDRWVRIGRADAESRDAGAAPAFEAAALGLVHDGARWQLLCSAGEDGELRAEALDEATTVEVLPRRHSPTPSFDALAAWDQLRVAPLATG
ncbi:MAG: hypothetical protein QOJ25_1517 [Solirubrobacteraceae bacterium]|nr:hypothetical protein [Solirubrobacteraceae bacterium]